MMTMTPEGQYCSSILNLHSNGFCVFHVTNLPGIFLSEGSTKVASEATDIARSTFYPASGLSNMFGFKIQDKQGRMHRFNCGMYPYLTSSEWSYLVVFLAQ
jgi:hypothetical protein